MKKYILFLLLILTQIIQAEECFFINFDTAWERVCAYAPALLAAEAERGIREAEARQVALIPNPVISVEAENLGVREHDDDVEPPETTIAVSQLLELGGKRGARRSMAEALSQIAFWDAQIVRQDMRQAVLNRFIEAAVCQERVALAQERMALEEKNVQALALLVDCGKVSPIQEKKAMLALKGAEVVLRERMADFCAAKKALAALWGACQPDFCSVDFNLYVTSAPPSLCALADSFLQTPEYGRAQAVICSSERNLNLQKRNAIPDLNVAVGYTIFNDSGRGGWLVGAEMPIPIFDRNQGNIQRARIGIAQAQYQLEELIRSFKESLLTTHELLWADFEEVEMMLGDILVEARETKECVEQGYQAGKVDFFELLDAGRTLYELEEELLTILCHYQRNRVALARLVGEC